jgi:hypothetical protein
MAGQRLAHGPQSARLTASLRDDVTGLPIADAPGADVCLGGEIFDAKPEHCSGTAYLKAACDHVATMNLPRPAINSK